MLNVNITQRNNVDVQHAMSTRLITELLICLDQKLLIFTQLLSQNGKRMEVRLHDLDKHKENVQLFQKYLQLLHNS